MEKNTKILLGIGAAIVAYLILKPKKAKGQTLTKEQKPKNTKDCMRTIHYCGTRPSLTEIIQIPLDAKCESYSMYPPCAEPPPPDFGFGKEWSSNKVDKSMIFDTADIVDMSQMVSLGNDLYEYNGKKYTITLVPLGYKNKSGTEAHGWDCVDSNGKNCSLYNFPPQ
jgi:hypothetical protein